LNARLKDQVKEAEAAKAHMKIQLEEADRVNAQLKDQVIEAQQANVQLNVQLEEADRVNAQLKDQLRAAEEDSKQAREEKHLDLWLRGQMIVQLNEQMRLLSEVASYRDRLSVSEQTLSKLDEELRKAVGEKEGLERKLADALEEKGRMESDVTASQKELSAVLVERKDLRRKFVETIEELKSSMWIYNNYVFRSQKTSSIEHQCVNGVNAILQKKEGDLVRVRALLQEDS